MPNERKNMEWLLNDKDGYRSIDYIAYIDAEKLYNYGLEKKLLVSN